MRRVLLIGAALAYLGACGDDPAPELHSNKRLVVFGVDGMDPKLLRKYMAEGRMPNLKALAERGGFVELATSDPPQSPVAWSNFMTGQHWDGHGIYDFVHRDPKAMEPYLSTSRVDAPDSSFQIGSMVLSFSSSEIELLREGRTFWQDLEEAGVPANIVKMPANFPPAHSRSTRSLSGMGTPDLMGTPGTFQLFTSDPVMAEKKMSGGIVHKLQFDGQRARTSLTGPIDPLSAAGNSMSLPLEILVDKQRPVALITLDETKIILQPGEWSEWIEVGFDPGILASPVPGIVRLYLAEIGETVRLYVSPINLDPRAPAMPLSEPSSYASELAADIGPYYTQGMPLDTKALVAGALTDEELLTQAEIAFQERLALLDRELKVYDGGLLFFYFSLLDQLGHVYWRTMEDDATPEEAKLANVIPDIYHRIDAAIGDAIKRLGDNTDILVVSDHGFSPYSRRVHLNAWLANQGYLAALPVGQVKKGTMGHVDWANTQAYGLGLNQLFLNLRGREKFGVVDAERKEVLLDRLERELLAWRDPDNGTRVVTRVTRPDVGQFGDRAPDLLVGYNRGYRSSDSSALGQIGPVEVDKNNSKWSGDHCMDPSHVPGVLLSNRPVKKGMSLTDLAPTVLKYFEVAPTQKLSGASVFAE